MDVILFYDAKLRTIPHRNIIKITFSTTKITDVASYSNFMDFDGLMEEIIMDGASSVT